MEYSSIRSKTNCTHQNVLLESFPVVGHVRLEAFGTIFVSVPVGSRSKALFQLGNSSHQLPPTTHNKKVTTQPWNMEGINSNHENMEIIAIYPNLVEKSNQSSISEYCRHSLTIYHMSLLSCVHHTFHPWLISNSSPMFNGLFIHRWKKYIGQPD
jgi:hypothetical protein